MIQADPALSAREHAAAADLLRRILAGPPPHPSRIILFGSKARGEDGPCSDLDLLILCPEGSYRKDEIGRSHAALAARIRARYGAPLETWTVAERDLQRGRRTPMLVDAIADGRTLWPAGARELRIRFTAADALFCAGRLLRWVDEGGPTVRRALDRGRNGAAAARIRDDITRMATASLLLTGDTRHRRRESLRRFAKRFLATATFTPLAGEAVRWADRAYPPRDGGRRPPPPTRHAAATAHHGFELAAAMQKEVVPWVLNRMDDLLARASHREPSGHGLSARAEIPPSTPLPPATSAAAHRSGTDPSAAP